MLVLFVQPVHQVYRGLCLSLETTNSYSWFHITNHWQTVPGTCPSPSCQGKLNICTLHAIAKAVVSFLDKKNMDSSQDKIETILQNCIGSTNRTWPTEFNNKIIKVEGEDKRFRAVLKSN